MKPFWSAPVYSASMGGGEKKGNKEGEERSLISPSASAFVDSSVLLIWTFSLKAEFPFIGWSAGHIEDGGIIPPRVILPNPH